MSYSSWHLTHFLLFFSLSYKYPKCQSLIFLLGVLWEMIEIILETIRKNYLISNNKDYIPWWTQGAERAVIDICINTTYLFAMFIRSILTPKNQKIKKLE